MMMLRLLLAAVLLFGGCSGNDRNEAIPRDTLADAQPVSDSARAEALPQRPETRQDTLLLEGMPEVERATLVRSPSGFAIPFSTYVSNGLRTEFRTEGSGASVRFSAAFGGVENRNAYMQVYMYEPGVPRPVVRDVIEGFIRSRAPASDETLPTDTPPWALEAMRYSYIGTGGIRFTGRVMTGEHAGRFFHVIIHYPEEYAEGMGPRVENILRHWRWEDTGAMLVR